MDDSSDAAPARKGRPDSRSRVLRGVQISELSLENKHTRKHDLSKKRASDQLTPIEREAGGALARAKFFGGARLVCTRLRIGVVVLGYPRREENTRLTAGRNLRTRTVPISARPRSSPHARSLVSFLPGRTPGGWIRNGSDNQQRHLFF